MIYLLFCMIYQQVNSHEKSHIWGFTLMIPPSIIKKRRYKIHFWNILKKFYSFHYNLQHSNQQHIYSQMTKYFSRRLVHDKAPILTATYNETTKYHGSSPFNPFQSTGLLLYTMKISQNQRFSDVLRGYRKRQVAWNGLKWLIN